MALLKDQDSYLNDTLHAPPLSQKARLAQRRMEIRARGRSQRSGTNNSVCLQKSDGWGEITMIKESERSMFSMATSRKDYSEGEVRAKLESTL